MNDKKPTLEQLDTEVKKLQAALHKATKAAERRQALASLGSMADGIAHDLNNHLMVILGNAEFCLMDLPQKCSGYESMKAIQVEARKAAQLCRRMLSFSSRASIDQGFVNLTGLVKDMQHLLRLPLGRNARIEYRLAEDMPLIRGNPAVLRQIVLALVGSAEEHADPVSEWVIIETGVMDCDEQYLRDPRFEEKLEPGQYALLRISSMIQPDRATAVGRCDAERHVSRHGGPDSVMGMIHKHNGALKTWRDENGSLIYAVLFPPAEAAAMSSANRSGSPNEDEAAWSGSGVVLLVEEEEQVRVMAERMLRLLGFDVLCASCGAEAVELYGQNSPSISAVLLDATMKGMSGAETIKALRAMDDKVRVIIATGYDAGRITAGMHEEPPTGVIEKPYDLQGLARVLREALAPAG